MKIFPKELTSLYFKTTAIQQENKIILPGRTEAKIQKIKKEANGSIQNIKAKTKKDEENGPGLICNECYEYMIPGKSYKIYLKDDKILVKQCLKCGFEKKQRNWK